MVLAQCPQLVTPVTWLSMPQLLTIEQACLLSGLGEPMMRWMIADGAVEAVDGANGDYLVDKDSLELYLETVAEVLHWED